MSLPPLNQSRNGRDTSSEVALAKSRDSNSPILPFAPSSAPHTSNARFHHVFVDFRGLAAKIATAGETVELYLSLFNRTNARYITEDFCLVLDHNGVPVRPDSLSRMSTLFNDLSHHDVQDQLYLVCRIVKNGGFGVAGAAPNAMHTPPMSSHRSTFMSASPGGRSESVSIPDNSSAVSLVDNNEVERLATSPEMLTVDSAGRFSCRRLFGCAVLEIDQLNHRKPADGDAIEQRLPIFVPVNESSFASLHEDIIASRTREFATDLRADHVAVAVRILQGDGPALAARNLSGHLTLTNRLGFPDVVFPDDRRNEVFVKLWSGEFASTPGGGGGGGATSTTRSLAALTAASNAAARNVEISVELRHRDGRPFEGALSRGAGEPNVTRFTSTVMRANINPSEHQAFVPSSLSLSSDVGTDEST